MSETLELRMKLRSDFLSEMKKMLGRDDLTGTELTREALTAFRWLARERSEGRVIVSADSNTLEPVYRLAQPILEDVPGKIVPAAARAAV